MTQGKKCLAFHVSVLDTLVLLHLSGRGTNSRRRCCCRGTVNPETGIMRANCEDSVAWGNYGAFDPGLVARFHGDIGQKFTVECPDSCRKARASIWGCNPFMDESSICKAALGMNRITNDGGLVSFQIVPPEDHWDSCKLQQGINTDKWKWYEWKKADRPNKIARKCSKDWVASSPGVPCPEVVKKYRQNCKVTHGIEHCFGMLLTLIYRFVFQSDLAM